MKNENSSSKTPHLSPSSASALQRNNTTSFTASGTNLTFSGVEDGVNSVTVMMGRDMEWTGGGGGGGTGGGTTFTCGTSTTDGFAEKDEAECAGVPDGEPPLRSP